MQGWFEQTFLSRSLQGGTTSRLRSDENRWKNNIIITCLRLVVFVTHFVAPIEILWFVLIFAQHNPIEMVCTLAHESVARHTCPSYLILGAHPQGRASNTQLDSTSLLINTNIKESHSRLFVATRPEVQYGAAPPEMGNPTPG